MWITLAAISNCTYRRDSYRLHSQVNPTSKYCIINTYENTAVSANPVIEYSCLGIKWRTSDGI